MNFDGSRFDRICLTGHGDAPGRFTSCCVSQEGNLTLVRVQDGIRLGLNRLANWTSISAQAGNGRSRRAHPAAPPVQVDLQFVDQHGLHLILWDAGVPHMCGLFIPCIRGLRGLEAVGWFARQHDLSLEAFLASVREVRTADEHLPLLLTTFSASRARCSNRLEDHWQLLELLSLQNGLPGHQRRWIDRSFPPQDLQRERVRDRDCIAFQSRIRYPRARLPTINRLSGRFRFDDHPPE